MLRFIPLKALVLAAVTSNVSANELQLHRCVEEMSSQSAPLGGAQIAQCFQRTLSKFVNDLDNELKKGVRLEVVEEGVLYTIQDAKSQGAVNEVDEHGTFMIKELMASSEGICYLRGIGGKGHKNAIVGIFNGKYIAKIKNEGDNYLAYGCASPKILN